MFRKIDNILNKITMYQTVLYCLLVILFSAFVLSFFGLMPFKSFDLISSSVFILAVCILSNAVFAWAFEAPTNIESVYITALILTLIINPTDPMKNLIFLFWISVLAMASKYIFATGKKHLFNPVAISVVLVSVVAGKAASWWIAGPYMLPFVFLFGLLVVRKIKRFDMVASFLITALITVTVFNFIHNQNIFSGLQKTFLYSPLLFFAFIMLTEPMTIPPSKIMRILYGMIVGFLFAPQVHIGSVYFTPEMALVLGNIFSYLISPDKKLILTLDRIVKLTPDIYDYEFISDQKIEFVPGQYMEWTLEHPSQDSRGIRRYFTVASSPTEEKIHLGVKFYNNSSSFKKNLLKMKEKETIVASQLSGDFTLPKNINKKLVFIAGGIGITPFRSMIKYMLDNNERRPVVLFYSNWKYDDIAYKDIFDKANQRLGIKVVYSIVDDTPLDTKEGCFYCGFLKSKNIIEEVPDYKERIFYISGPPSMVTSFVNTLRKIGVKKTHIKTDYFPGFAS